MLNSEVWELRCSLKGVQKRVGILFQKLLLKVGGIKSKLGDLHKRGSGRDLEMDKTPTDYRIGCHMNVTVRFSNDVFVEFYT